MSYTQKENEPLNTYNVILYNSSRVQLSKSATMYGTSTLEYGLHDLADATQYYVRCLGETLNGMVADTGYIPFSVKYIVPTYWTYVDLTNNKDDGTVRISSNIRTIEGKFTGSGNPTYIDNAKVDLRKNGDRVIFHEGFALQGNFTVKMLGSDFGQSETILEMVDGNDTTLTVKYIKGWFAEGSYMAKGQSATNSLLGIQVPYLDLRCAVKGDVIAYAMQSEPMGEPGSGQEYLIKAQKNGDVFNITTQVVNTADYETTAEEV